MIGASVAARARRLPLFWKLLVPFAVLLLVVGAAGTFVLVRNFAAQAQATVDQELAQRLLSARAVVHDRELYLLESANLAANLQGMAEAVRRRDEPAARGLLRTVLALKQDLALTAVVRRDGHVVAHLGRDRPQSRADSVPPLRRAPAHLVGPTLAKGRATAGILSLGGEGYAAMAVPVCLDAGRCEIVGASVAAFPLDLLLHGALKQSVDHDALALLAPDGQLLAASGQLPRGLQVQSTADGPAVRQNLDGQAVASAPVELQGDHVGTLVVSMSTDATFEAVRSTGVRLGLILLLAMIGIVIIGALLSRLILGQVQQLVRTNRALAAGDLAARVPVVVDDELGELARGVNRMAAALQESHETLEGKVEERTAEVQRLLQERTDFFTAVSHEFRTPLAVILGYADMLADMDREKSAAWQQQAGATVRGAAGQLLSFINDILDIAKVEANRMELHLDEVRVDALLREVKPTLESLASGSRLRLHVRATRGIPPVRADEIRLREILFNLVDNAVKYTPAGGIVTVSATTEEAFVVVSVSDTGVGIPEDQMSRLFEPFYRAEGIRTQNGQPSSGLGLALVRRLVEAHGGTVKVASEVGRGTTFTVRLPSAMSPQPTDTAPPSPAAPDRSIPISGPGTALYASRPTTT